MAPSPPPPLHRPPLPEPPSPLPSPPSPPPLQLYDMNGEWTFLAFEILLVVVTVGLLTKYLAGKSVPLAVKVVVGLSWGVSIFLFALVPLDVALTVGAPSNESTTGAQSALRGLYLFPYIMTQLLTWLLLPFYQSYSDAGDFTHQAKLRRSVRENAIFYGVLLGLGLTSICLLLALYGTVHPTKLIQCGIAFSLSFSVATGMLLMGYGLAEIPRICWMRSVLTTRQRWCEHGVGKLSDKLALAHTELGKVVWSADQMSNTMPRRHDLRWAMDVIDESIQKSAVAGVSPDSEEGDDEEYDYEDINALANLRSRLQRAIVAFERVKHEFVSAVVVAIEVGDIVDCRTAGRTSGDQKFRSSLRPPRVGPNATLKDRLEYQWKCIFRRYLMRTLAILLAITSVVLILAEVTIWLQLPGVGIKGTQVSNLSIISLIISEENGNDFGTMLVVALVLFYMLASTYFTVLRLAMFSFFHVVPGHTDAQSLIISATLFSRYASPLCVNFLSMLPLVHLVDRKESVFENVMGIHTNTADGKHRTAVYVYFIDIFPIMLGVFCPLVTFGGLAKLKGLFSKSRFSISEEGMCDETTAKGRAILDREKENIRNGGRPGETHSAFTVRSREAKKRPAIGGYFARGKAEPNTGQEAAGSGEEQRSLLSAERERPLARSDDVKTRLAARMEAIGQTSQAAVGRIRAATLPSAGTAPPTSRPVAGQPPALPPKPKSGAGGTSSLDDFFNNLGR